MPQRCTTVGRSLLVKYSGNQADLERILEICNDKRIESVMEVRDNADLLIVTYGPNTNEAEVLDLLNQA